MKCEESIAINPLNHFKHAWAASSLYREKRSSQRGLLSMFQENQSIERCEGGKGEEGGGVTLTVW